MTRIEMARVIFKALYGLPCLPSREHPEVKLLSLRRLAAVERQYLMALRVLDQERVRCEQEMERVAARNAIFIQPLLDSKTP